MYKQLVLVPLCIVLFSCDSDTVDSSRQDSTDTLYSIHSLKWFPGDSMIAAIAHEPQFTGSAKLCTYDLRGNLLSEMALPYFYSSSGSFYISQDGLHIIYNDNGSIYSIDIDKRISKPIHYSRITSRLPGTDMYLLQHGGYFSNPMVIARIANGSVDSLRAMSAELLQSASPFLLTEGSIATIIPVTTSSTSINVWDVSTSIGKSFHIPTSFISMRVTVTPNRDFFFLLYNINSTIPATISKFRTDLGIMELIQQISGFEYAVTSNGDRLVCQTDTEGCFVIQVQTGIKTPLSGIQQFVAVDISHNDRMIAFATPDGGNKLTILPMP